MFRHVVSVPANAASELRAVLPAALTSRLDLTRLTTVPASFVDETLTWRHSDVLLTAPLDGHDAFVYFLIEHQSAHDPLMAYRMLRYLIRIWDHHLRQHPRARRLPAIIPLVVYQGPHTWTSPTQLADLIDLDPTTHQHAQPWLPHFQFLLDDLTHTAEHQLLARDLTLAMLLALLLLKTARGNQHLITDLRRWISRLRALLDQPGGNQAFTAFLTYIEQVSEIPASDLHDLIATLGPDAMEAYVTIADTLRAEGEARGKAEGRAEGRAEGIAQGEARAKADAIRVVFEQRGIDISDKSRELIESCTDLDTLDTWFRRAFTVDNDSDLFEN